MKRIIAKLHALYLCKKGEGIIAFIALIALVILFIIIINRVAPGAIQRAITSVFDKIQQWIGGNENP